MLTRLTRSGSTSSTTKELATNGSNGNVDEIGRITFDDTFFVVTGNSFSDTDGDLISNHCDFDSDNDGISDLQESGNALAIAADTDMNGVICS